ncbi:MAG: DinB family protein [Anaerolineales bacterium]|jgi:uncharacterized damage-inducible protein DinB
MTKFYNDLIDRLSELHTDIGKSLEGLPVEALDWVPGPEMNSLSVLVFHLTGSERYWIGVAINEAPERDREAEFRTKGVSAEELKARLVSADEFARESLASLSLKDLEAARHSPRNDKSFSAGWCLAHALEHSALHTGHIQITRQLWDLR